MDVDVVDDGQCLDCNIIFYAMFKVLLSVNIHCNEGIIQFVV